MMASNEESSVWMTEETRSFRATVRKFIGKEMAPLRPSWEAQGRPDRDIWRKAGEAGLLLADLPAECGGAGGTFAHEAVMVEELARANIHIGFGIQSIVAHYIHACGDAEQHLQWLPRMASAELVGAVCMTEPDAGSDLQGIKTTARRDGDDYIVNGAKRFISNGNYADLLCVAVRTGSSGPRALSLLMVETAGLAGFRTGPDHKKIGRHAQNTCDLYFDDVRVPAANLLGASEGRGLFQMMDQLPYERLAIGLSAVVAAEHAVEITTRYVKERKAFGKPLLEFQNTRFKLAECRTAAHVGRLFIDDCIARHLAGRLDAVTAAMAKYWLTEAQGQIVDDCVQLHGGYGYMQDFEIARMWADGRAQRLYAGSNEIMKEAVGWSL
jgi:acyl-CoA dehydrogenase